MAEAAKRKDMREAFFVYIVESPSAPDLYHNRSEGSAIADTLRLDGIPCVTRIAINMTAFVAALKVGLNGAMKELPGRYPILHLSAHGGENGIQLSSGEVVTWPTLRELITPINQSLEGMLVLCMSACEGYAACGMAMQDGDAPHPYFGMVGNTGSPTWSDTAVAYLAFYHLLGKDRSIDECLEAMRAASGDLQWSANTAESLKQGYLEFLKGQVEPQAVQQGLATVAAAQDVTPDAKGLEQGASDRTPA